MRTAGDEHAWITMDFASFVDHFWDITVDGLTFGGIYALIALGYTLVYGVLKLINFAHSEVFILGCYGAVFALTGLGFDASPSAQISWSVAMGLGVAALAAVLASSAVAFLVEFLAYRPLIKRESSGLVFLITAIGTSYILQYCIFLLRGPIPEPAVMVLMPTQLFELFGTTIYLDQCVIIGAAVAMMIGVDRLIHHSRIGRGMRALAQDPNTAVLLGIHKERTIRIAFIVGGALAGVAALFYVMKVPSGVVYNGGFLLGLKAFTAAVLGGIGNLRGALIGGLALGLISNYGQILLGHAQWADVTAFAVLIVVLLLRPQGLLGHGIGKSTG